MMAGPSKPTISFWNGEILIGEVLFPLAARGRYQDPISYARYKLRNQIEMLYSGYERDRKLAMLHGSHTRIYFENEVRPARQFLA